MYHTTISRTDKQVTMDEERGTYKKSEDKQLDRVCCDGTRKNGFSVRTNEGGPILTRYKKEVFTMRVVRDWHRLPRDMVGAPSWKHSR